MLNKSITLLLLVFICVGCSSYEITRSGTLKSTLSSDATIYIEEPRDGAYEGQPYEASGSKAAVILHRSFSKYFDNVIIGSGYSSSGIRNTSSQTGVYRVRVALIHWEDRATEWSGKPDRITVKLELLDAKNLGTQRHGDS